MVDVLDGYLQEEVLLENALDSVFGGPHCRDHSEHQWAKRQNLPVITNNPDVTVTVCQLSFSAFEFTAVHKPVSGQQCSLQ